MYDSNKIHKALFQMLKQQLVENPGNEVERTSSRVGGTGQSAI